MPDDRFSVHAWLRGVLSDRCTLDPHEALVMLALVRHADEQGRAFPGFGTIVRETRAARTKVIESIAELEARTLFARVAQTRGKGLGANTYHLPPEPPTEGLEGARRLVRRARQSAIRTGTPDVPGGAPHALGVVRQADGGSAPGAPYLLTDLPKGTDQVTATAREAAPTKGARRGKAKAPELPLAPDWQPTEAHRAYAAKHGLDLELEADGLRGWAEGRTAVSWNGTFSTRLANAAKWQRQGRQSHGKPVVQRGGTIREGDASWLNGGGE